jgi:hypothetical protein
MFENGDNITLLYIVNVVIRKFIMFLFQQCWIEGMDNVMFVIGQPGFHHFHLMLCCWKLFSDITTNILIWRKVKFF